MELILKLSSQNNYLGTVHKIGSELHDKTPC